MTADQIYSDKTKDMETAEGMNDLAQNAFSENYSLIAKQIKTGLGLAQGNT